MRTFNHWLSLKTVPPQAAVPVNLIAKVLSSNKRGSTYHDQFNVLVDKGYLVQTSGNTFEFYEVPKVSATSDSVNQNPCVKWYSEVGSNHQPDDYKSSVLTDWTIRINIRLIYVKKEPSTSLWEIRFRNVLTFPRCSIFDYLYSKLTITRLRALVPGTGLEPVRVAARDFLTTLCHHSHVSVL